jgi:hypothetical protein
MGYYQAGDYYSAGDAITKFMPGVGTLRTIAKHGLRHALAKSPSVIERGLSKLVGKAKRTRHGRHRMIGAMRRYRRMNPLNAKALRRALRRARGFEHFARSVISITRPTKGRRWKFHRRRRK